MNKLLLTTLLVLLVAGSGVLLVWADGDGSAAAPGASQAALDDDLQDMGPVEAMAAGIDEEAEPENDAPPAGLLEMARQEVAAAAAVDLLVVQVWEGEPGVPAASADVFVLDGFEGPELEDPYAQHWSDLAERHGRRYVSDVEGRVELPPVRERAIVTAQRSGMFGYTRVGRQHRDVETITLYPDETVTVRVTDGEGATVAGVPVGVLQRVPIRQDAKKYRAQLGEFSEQVKRLEAHIRDNPSQRQAATARLQAVKARWAKAISSLQELEFAKQKADGGVPRKQYRPAVTTHVEVRARRETDADGIAVFRHFQVYRSAARKWWPDEYVDRFEAVLLMPLQRAAGVAFAGRPVPTETLELHLPPTGTLALRTIDRDGRPFTHPVHADLRRRESDSAPWSRVRQRKEQNENEIVFPFVGLGLQFTADCRLDDEDLRWTLPLFAGPSSPGERLTVDLVVAPAEGMLHGRLLDGAGTPLAGVRSSFLINSLAGRLEGEEITADTGGRFHLPYQVREQHRPPFRLEIRRAGVRPTAGLAMPLPILPAGRVTDLGDLRIDGLSAIAHGTVVDDRGLPLAAARVQLQRERQVGGDKPRLAFVDEAFAVGETDAEGQFVVFGELESGRYRLRAQARDHFPLESSDLRRSEATNLRLERKARVVGTVLTPSWMPSRGVRVVLQSAIDPKQRREDKIRDHEGKKYIYFDWVRPGIYSLSLLVQDFPDPFLRIDGLELAPGQLGLHPRLTDLDLAAYLFRFEVLAVDEQNRRLQPKRPLLARITRADGRTGFVGFSWKTGRAEVFSTSPQLEVWPMSAGYHAEPTVLVPGRSELRFSKIPPVELLVPGLRQLVGATPVWLGMTAVGGSGLPDRLDTWDGRSGRIAKWYGRGRAAYAPLRQGDAVPVALVHGGRFRVDAYMGDKAKGSMVRVELGEVEVRIRPGAGPVRVPVGIDVARVQAGLAQVAQRAAASEKGG